MAIYYRKESYREKLFCKNLHLKSKTQQVVSVLPEVFEFDDFLDAFKICYSYTYRLNQEPKQYSCSTCRCIDALTGSYIAFVEEDVFLANPNYYIDLSFGS